MIRNEALEFYNGAYDVKPDSGDLRKRSKADLRGYCHLGRGLCTGDIALINEAGFLKIKGRSDDLIIKSGMNSVARIRKVNPKDFSKGEKT